MENINVLSWGGGTQSTAFNEYLKLKKEYLSNTKHEQLNLF